MTIASAFPNNPVVSGDLDPDVFVRSPSNQISLKPAYSRTTKSLVPKRGSNPDNYLLSSDGTWVEPGPPIDTTSAKTDYVRGRAFKIEDPGNYTVPTDGVAKNANSHFAYFDVTLLTLIGYEDVNLILPGAPNIRWANAMNDRLIMIKTFGLWAGILNLKTTATNGIDNNPASKTVGIDYVKNSSPSQFVLLYRWAGTYWAQVGE